MEQVFAILLAWISANTDYRDLPPPNAWQQLSPQELQAVSDHSGGPAGGGVYRCSTKTVYLRADLDTDNVGAVSEIVHELVHHAQCVTGWTRLSPCEKEREAYAVQLKFVQQYAPAPGAKERAAEVLGKAADAACEVLNRR